jgi:hypothetical protein
MKLDDRDIDQLLAREEMGVRHGYRATALSTRYKTGMQRDSKGYIKSLGEHIADVLRT